MLAFTSCAGGPVQADFVVGAFLGLEVFVAHVPGRATRSDFHDVVVGLLEGGCLVAAADAALEGQCTAQAVDAVQARNPFAAVVLVAVVAYAAHDGEAVGQKILVLGKQGHLPAFEVDVARSRKAAAVMRSLFVLVLGTERDHVPVQRHDGLGLQVGGPVFGLVGAIGDLHVFPRDEGTGADARTPFDVMRQRVVVAFVLH